MDDLISRAAALNAIDCWHIDFNSMDGAKVQTDCWRTIKELPAVNAIPVEWLRKVRKDDKLTLDDVETIDLLLAWWQQEQEAQE